MFSIEVVSFSLCLGHKLPACEEAPPQAVEVVHHDAPHVGLESLVDVLERNALDERLLPVDIDEDLGHLG